MEIGIRGDLHSWICAFLEIGILRDWHSWRFAIMEIGSRGDWQSWIFAVVDIGSPGDWRSWKFAFFRFAILAIGDPGSPTFDIYENIQQHKSIYYVHVHR